MAAELEVKLAEDEETRVASVVGTLDMTVEEAVTLLYNDVEMIKLPPPTLDMKGVVDERAVDKDGKTTTVVVSSSSVAVSGRAEAVGVIVM